MAQYIYKYNIYTDEFDLVTNPNVVYPNGASQTEFELIAPGNTAKDQLGNWKFVIDSGNNFCKYKCTFTYPITWELVEINTFYDYP